MYGIELNRQSELPLWRQIYQSLRDQILCGQLAEEEVLPSTRELAKDIGVSRNTVSEAYEMLITESFVISRQGAPTRVAQGLHVEKSAVTPTELQAGTQHVMRADFHTGRPDLRLFPRFLWQQLLHQASMEMPVDQYGYTGPQGQYKLREEISAWLYRSRSLIVDSQDIFITAGATHALHLIAALLCNDRRDIIMEDPCHYGMLQAFINKGCRIIPVPVDEQGMQTDYLTSSGTVSAAYVTPSHQFPLGGILPASRRASLIRYAQENNIYIIEDDYDSEFRYCGEPVAPLKAMDPQRVIYVGTFSKTLFPALRIGYVILPRRLHKQWQELRTYTDVQNPPFEQAALAEFLYTRKIDRYIQKMRRIYGERRQVLLNSLSESFGNSWCSYGDAAGLHQAIEFPDLHFDEEFKKDCLRNGIYITLVENHCIKKGAHDNKLLLGYGHLDPVEIRNGIRLLYEYMNHLIPNSLE